MDSADIHVKRFDGFAALAFCLALFIMVLPTEADLLFSLFQSKQYALGGLLEIFCLTIVLLLFLISWCRHACQRENWRGRGCLIGAGVILALHLFFGVAGFVSVLFR